jgi:acyl dehydratase
MMILCPSSIIEYEPFGEITLEQLKKYSEASGDFNLIHLNEEVAHSAGLPGIIAHGMLIAALIAERATRFVRSQTTLNGFELAQFQTRFKAMVYLGDVPFIGGEIKKISDCDLILDLKSKNQNGEITTTALVHFKKIS